MTLEDFEKLDIPDTPGVYMWKRGGEILYIGKATSLRDRVRSYFSTDLISTRGPRMVDMVFKADRIEWQETDSVLEALIAEANAIKKHQPHYNVQEKDDKSWNYVVVTREAVPRILVIRGRTLDVERQKKLLKVRRTFGPFTSGSALREALKIIRRMFPFIDGNSSSKYTSGFYRQLGLAPETATDESLARYRKNIDRIILFFEGKKRALIRELEKEMDQRAKHLEFEEAADLKHKIFALEHIQDVALIKEDVESAAYHAFDASGAPVVAQSVRIEAYDTAHMSGKESAGVMTVIHDGELAKSEYRKFKLSLEIGNNDIASLREIISRRLRHSEWPFPDIMVIDGSEVQQSVAEEAIKDFQSAKPIVVVAVVKDEKHKPKGIIGPENIIEAYKKSILLANSEAHRFALAYHRKLRRMRNPRRRKL